MKVTGPFVKSKAVSTRSALKLPEPERTRGESHSPSGDEPHKSSQQFSIFKSKFCVKQIRYEMIINEFSSCFQADFVIFAQTQGSYCLLSSVFVLDWTNCSSFTLNEQIEQSGLHISPISVQWLRKCFLNCFCVLLSCKKKCLLQESYLVQTCSAGGDYCAGRGVCICYKNNV